LSSGENRDLVTVPSLAFLASRPGGTRSKLAQLFVQLLVAHPRELLLDQVDFFGRDDPEDPNCGDSISVSGAPSTKGDCVQFRNTPLAHFLAARESRLFGGAELDVAVRLRWRLLADVPSVARVRF
jgi:hypothetical protein